MTQGRPSADGSSRPRNAFVFVLEERFTMQALSSAVEVLRLARKFRGREAYDFAIGALAPGPVAASNGVEVLAPLRFMDAHPHAVLVVVSGAEATERSNPSLTDGIRLMRRRGHPIWGVSSGVVRMAEAGLFAGPWSAETPAPKVAAHWEDAPHLRAAYPDLALTASLFAWGDGLATCAGGSAAADLMMDYLRRSGDAALVEEIVARLILDGERDGRLAQTQAIDHRLSTTDRTAFAALRLMRGHLHEPLSIGDVADRCRVPQRRLERLFQREFGASPLRIYREMRLASARQEVLAGRRAIGDVALDYGFSVDRFARAYRALYGASPRADRAAGLDAKTDEELSKTAGSQ